MEESQRLISCRNSEESQFVLSQPLDANSEEVQRRVSQLAFDLHRQIDLVNHRLDLQRKMKKADGGISLAQERLTTFEHLRSLGEETRRYGDRLAQMETACASHNASRRVSSSIAPFAGGRGQLVPQSRRQTDSLELFLSMGPEAFGSLAPPSTSVFSFPDAAKVGRTGSTPRNESALRRAPDSSIQKDPAIFSPPPVATRPQWDVLSSVDQSKARQVSFTSPQKLNETTVADEAPGVLNKFGTTPEKLRAYSDARKQPSPPKPTGMTKSAAALSLPSQGQERRVQPERATSDTPNPPLAATSRGSDSDKTQSQTGSFSVRTPAKPPADKPSENTSITKSVGVTSFGNSSSDKPNNQSFMPSLKTDSSSAGGFGSMSELGQSSLFSASAGPTSSSGTKESAPGQLGESKTPDYRKLLSEFYQKHSTKTPDFDKLLTSYKV